LQVLSAIKAARNAPLVAVAGLLIVMVGLVAGRIYT
jgi:hypothetical protein